MGWPMEEASNSSNAHVVKKIIVYTWSEYSYLTQQLIDIWEQM
jgi:hypothetical protein